MFSPREIIRDLDAVVKRSRDVAGKLSGGIGFLMKKNRIEVVIGTAWLEKGSPAPIVRVKTKDGEDAIKAKHVILATGARARTPGSTLAHARG